MLQLLIAPVALFISGKPTFMDEWPAYFAAGCGTVMTLLALLARKSNATRRIPEGAPEHPTAVNNLIWFLTRENPERVATEAAALLQQLAAARDELQTRRPLGWEATVPYLVGTGAEVKRLMGALDESLRELDEADRLGGMNVERLLLRARLMKQLQRPDDARRAAEQALAAAHPDSLTAQEAREYLAAKG